MAKKRSIGSEMVAKRYANMTPEQRSAAAKNAADKRWAKKRPGVKKNAEGKADVQKKAPK